MVHSCCAYNCSQRFERGAKIAFHRFPLNNPPLLLKWILAIRRVGFVPTRHSTVCSRHFKEDDYVDPLGTFKPRLKPDAVPSVFNFGDDSTKRKRKRKWTEENDDAPQDPSGSDASTGTPLPLLEEEEEEVVLPNLAAPPSSTEDGGKLPEKSKLVIHYITAAEKQDPEPKETSMTILMKDIPLERKDISIRLPKSARVKPTKRPMARPRADSDASPSCDEVENGCGCKCNCPCPRAASGRAPDHCYASFKVDSNETSEIAAKVALRKKIKVLQQQVRRKDKKVKELSRKLEEMKNENFVLNDLMGGIRNRLSGLSWELFFNECQNKSKGVNGRRYSESLKKFAQTIYSYSPSAYNYLRTHFCLPAARSLLGFPALEESDLAEPDLADLDSDSKDVQAYRGDMEYEESDCSYMDPEPYFVVDYECSEPDPDKELAYVPSEPESL